MFANKKTWIVWLRDVQFNHETILPQEYKSIRLTPLASSTDPGVRVWFMPWRRAMRWTLSTSQRGSSLSLSPPAPRSSATPRTSRRWRRCCGPNMAKTIWWDSRPLNPGNLIRVASCVSCFLWSFRKVNFDVCYSILNLIRWCVLEYTLIAQVL